MKCNVPGPVEDWRNLDVAHPNNNGQLCILKMASCKVGEYRVGASGSWPAKIAKHT